MKQVVYPHWLSSGGRVCLGPLMDCSEALALLCVALIETGRRKNRLSRLSNGHETCNYEKALHVRYSLHVIPLYLTRSMKAR
jgi:hypothetical protein